MHDVELKAKTLGTDAPKYAGITGTQIAAFKKDLTRVFQNSIKWESEGRFIPDSVGDLDINDCTAADITASSTRPLQNMGCATEIGKIVSDTSPHSAPPISRMRPLRHVLDVAY